MSGADEADRGGPAGVPPTDAVERLAAMVRRAERALFITGAGISADSGLPTYRGVGGLYDDAATDEGIPIEVALSGPMFRAQPAITWKYIHQIERACRGAQPNPAHEVIAALQAQMPGLWVLTQNVDGFHHRAGSTRVIPIHGDVHALSCTGASCAWHERVPDYASLPALPRCPECEAVVRPDVVLFGEMLPDAHVEVMYEQAARGFDLVVSIGTTSAFPYIAAPVLTAAAAGADTVEINPGHTEVSEVVRLKIAARARPTFEALARALELEPA